MNSSLKPSQCANEIQMMQRASYLFKANVLTNTLIALLTLYLSYNALRVMKRKPIFSMSTTVLIWIYLVIVNAHGLIYAIIQLWSLYRAITYSTEPCKIMFTEYECFQWYTANILIRMMILFTLCSLTTDRLLAIVLPFLKSNLYKGLALFMIDVILATTFCVIMTSDGPNDNIQANCYQRLNRNAAELKNQINVYLFVILACFGINVCTALGSYYKNKRRSRFNMERQYEKQVEYNSSFGITLIIFFQLIFMGIYSISVNWLIDHPGGFAPGVVGNLVLWCYTYPYACLSLPGGILLAIKANTKLRAIKIKELKETNANEQPQDHFQKLAGEWDSGYNKLMVQRVSPAAVD